MVVSVYPQTSPSVRQPPDVLSTGTNELIPRAPHRLADSQVVSTAVSDLPAHQGRCAGTYVPRTRK